MIIGAIDVGTNSVKLLIARRRGPRLRVLVRRSFITRLGRGLNGEGRIAAEPADRTIEALKTLRRLCDEWKCDRIVAAGTEALRRARNGASFVRRCRKETGLPLRVIGPSEEARLSFLGATADWPARRLAALDVGGGSTELVIGRGGRPAIIRALPVGSVAVTETYLRSDPPAPGELERAARAIRRGLRRLPAPLRRADLVGVGGTAITAAVILRGKRRLHGTFLARRELEGLLESLASMKLSVRRRVAGLEPDRADIMPAGLMIILEVMRALKVERLRISRHGLRRGLILEESGRQE